MKKSEAVEILRGMMLTIQKMRSNAQETTSGLGIPMNITDDLLPFVTGNKCPLPVLIRVLDNYEQGTADIEPMLLFNMVFIARTLEPSLGMMCEILGYPMPNDPDTSWLRGFESE